MARPRPHEIVEFFLLVAFGCAAWVTHVGWAIFKLVGYGETTVGVIALGVMGALAPPVGVIHGVMIWFGYGLG